MTLPLEGKVAVVTGASRGVGKGVALGLGEAGATVIVTGRTLDAGESRAPGTLSATAAEVDRLGGRGVPVRCDHGDDAQVAALFERVRAEHGRLDVLVNNVFNVPRVSFAQKRFWEVPVSIWDDMHHVGLRSHYVASWHAAPLLIETGGSLVVNISSYGGGHYVFGVAYGVGKAGVDRMARDMGLELEPEGVAVVSLWPGLVRTERMMRLRALQRMPFDPAEGESPQLTGRAVAALAADPGVMRHTGRVLVVADLARDYGFTDVDGRQPEPLDPSGALMAQAAKKG